MEMFKGCECKMETYWPLESRLQCYLVKNSHSNNYAAATVLALLMQWHAAPSVYKVTTSAAVIWLDPAGSKVIRPK